MKKFVLVLLAITFLSACSAGLEDSNANDVEDEITADINSDLEENLQSFATLPRFTVSNFDLMTVDPATVSSLIKVGRISTSNQSPLHAVGVGEYSTKGCSLQEAKNDLANLIDLFDGYREFIDIWDTYAGSDFQPTTNGYQKYKLTTPNVFNPNLSDPTTEIVNIYIRSRFLDGAVTTMLCEESQINPGTLYQSYYLKYYVSGGNYVALEKLILEDADLQAEGWVDEASYRRLEFKATMSTDKLDDILQGITDGGEMTVDFVNGSQIGYGEFAVEDMGALGVMNRANYTIQINDGTVGGSSDINLDLWGIFNSTQGAIVQDFEGDVLADAAGDWFRSLAEIQACNPSWDEATLVCIDGDDPDTVDLTEDPCTFLTDSGAVVSGSVCQYSKVEPPVADCFDYDSTGSSGGGLTATQQDCTAGSLDEYVETNYVYDNAIVF